ncbi:MAG TPA: HNH endonuclease signature motif containing protein, partial [Streptosporangiaceae bacterium]|nr:HNH endonuclease signature motif containing protein [Streptosporangiaceae bacterium]
GVPVGHACAAPGRGPPPGPAALDWAAALAPRITWLGTGHCQHTRAEPRYRPSPALAHQVRIRQPHCDFPGCRQPATACDLDHTIPYQHGGLTCDCNLRPRSRHHHRAKQTPGWHVTSTPTGHTIWTTPSGRTYTSTGYRYPV